MFDPLNAVLKSPATCDFPKSLLCSGLTFKQPLNKPPVASPILFLRKGGGRSDGVVEGMMCGDV